MSVVLTVIVNGADVTDHVLVDSLSFESQMGAVPGTFEFGVKDSAKEEDFSTGAPIQISADGINLFGGFVLQVVRDFAFPVVDTSDLDKVTARKWTIRGLDFNTLFDKRILRNVADYTRSIPAYGPAPVTDGTYIQNRLPDLIDFGINFGTIDDVRTYDTSNGNPLGYTPMQQGSTWRQEMDNLAQWGALYYLDANAFLQYLAVESLEAHWGFSDKPDLAAIPSDYSTKPTYGMREFESTEDGSFIVNDAFVWGGSEWSKGLVFRRKQDASSITDHNRWQVAELHFGEKGYGIQEGVDERANVIVTGKLDGGTYGAANRGFALPQFQVRCTWFDKDVPTDPNTGLKAYLLPGQLVTFELFVFGADDTHPYTLVLPARSIRTSTPTLAPDGNTYLKFEGFFGVQSSDPWWLWKYLRSHTSNSTTQQTTVIVPVDTTDNSDSSTTYGAYGTFSPIEVPDGVITDFTLPNGFGYISGTTSVYVNGLAQVVVTDYTESDPTGGVISFVTAPAIGDVISIVCRTTATTSSSSFPPPSTPNGAFVIPGSIDPTGATDVQVGMNAWVDSVPDGSILQFAGGTFQMGQGIQIANRHNLVFDGQGATIFTSAGSSGSDQLSSNFIVGHQYGGSWSGGNTDIVIHDFDFVGNDPTPGTFTGGVESEANLEIAGVSRIEIYNCTGDAAYGDFIFFEDTDQAWVHDCHATTAGRNGVSVISGTNILVETSAFDVVGYVTFDVEPNNNTQASDTVTFQHNTAGTWGNCFFAVEGSHTGAHINAITCIANSVTSDSLFTVVDNGNTARMTNIIFSNNTSSTSHSGPVLTFAHVDGLDIEGNTQPVSSGSLTSITDCTGVVGP